MEEEEKKSSGFCCCWFCNKILIIQSFVPPSLTFDESWAYIPGISKHLDLSNFYTLLLLKLAAPPTHVQLLISMSVIFPLLSPPTSSLSEPLLSSFSACSGDPSWLPVRAQESPFYEYRLSRLEMLHFLELDRPFLLYPFLIGCWCSQGYHRLAEGSDRNAGLFQKLCFIIELSFSSSASLTLQSTLNRYLGLQVKLRTSKRQI